MNGFADAFASDAVLERIETWRAVRAEVALAHDERDRSSLEALPIVTAWYERVERMPYPAEMKAEMLAEVDPEGHATYVATLEKQKALGSAESEVMLRLQSALGDVLHEMGAAAGEIIVEHIDADSVPTAVIEDAYEAATEMRRTEMDRGRVAFDATGPFTNALYRRLASKLEIQPKGVRWMMDVAVRMMDMASEPSPTMRVS